MIDSKKHEEILKEGLLLDHYNVLYCLHNNIKIANSKRVTGFTNLLYKKGYLEDNELTDKAKKLLEGATYPSVNTAISIIEDKVETTPDKFDFGKWVVKLHNECENKIRNATGKRQVRDTINGKPYSFLPNAVDLGKSILRVVNLYKINDYERMRRTILLYIDRCIKSKQWFPILVYYIIKNNMSPMVTDMENIEDEEDDLKSNDTIVNI